MIGRDIEEQKLALLFSKQACTWTCTGSVAEQQTSQSKQQILDLLDGNEAMSPKEVAQALEKPYDAIKTTCLPYQKKFFFEPLNLWAVKRLLERSRKKVHSSPSLNL